MWSRLDLQAWQRILIFGPVVHMDALFMQKSIVDVKGQTHNHLVYESMKLVDRPDNLTLIDNGHQSSKRLERPKPVSHTFRVSVQIVMLQTTYCINSSISFSINRLK